MVRIVTFVGLLAGTYVGVKALDNFVIWMAERREANAENLKFERDAYLLKQELLKDLHEKRAIQNIIPKEHQKLSDKLPDKAQEQQNYPRFMLHKHSQECAGEIVVECSKCGETFELGQKVSYVPKDKKGLPTPKNMGT